IQELDCSLSIRIFVRVKMSKDVITVGSTMRIPLLYRGEISQLHESNETGKNLWDALEWQMRGFEYRKQDRKTAILYEYETFKDIEGEQLLDTYLRDVNDALGYKKKAVVVTSDPLALVAEKTKVSKRKEKVEVQTESEGSDDDDTSDLKKITELLAKAFNQKKYYAKLTNNNLRTSSASSSANKKPEKKMLLAKKDSDEQVLLAEDQAWTESSSDSD
nr:hypothetical protein [Tanacetum cinerariifolium]